MTEATLTQKQKDQLEQIQPMWKIVLSQFLEHRMAVAGLVVISFFILVALCAPLISMLVGISPEQQNPLNRYAGINTVTVLPSDQREDRILNYINRNPDGSKKLQKILIEKQLVTVEYEDDALYELAYMEIPEAKKMLSDIGTDEAKELRKIFSTFETRHLLGTDELGRDVLIRLVYGTRVSMSVGLLVAFSSTLIGLLIGSLAGYYRGWAESALMRVTDALLSLPIVPVQIVIAAVDLNKVPFMQWLVGSENESIIKLVFILVVFSWMGTARLVHGSILSLREREFILAAKTLGAPDFTVIVRHMFPNVIAPVLVSVTLGVGESILFEAGLSFLGLGIQPPTPSWGNMLFNAQELISEAPWLAILPGLLILFTTISFNYLGDGLQDAIDPKAIRR